MRGPLRPIRDYARCPICRTMVRTGRRFERAIYLLSKRHVSRCYSAGFVNVFYPAFIFPLKWRDNRAEKRWRTDRARSPLTAQGGEKREERALYDPPRSVHFDPFDIREENHILPRTTFISPGDLNSPYVRELVFHDEVAESEGRRSIDDRARRGSVRGHPLASQIPPASSRSRFFPANPTDAGTRRSGKSAEWTAAFPQGNLAKTRADTRTEGVAWCVQSRMHASVAGEGAEERTALARSFVRSFARSLALRCVTLRRR